MLKCYKRQNSRWRYVQYTIPLENNHTINKSQDGWFCDAYSKGGRKTYIEFIFFHDNKSRSEAYLFFTWNAKKNLRFSIPAHCIAMKTQNKTWFGVRWPQIAFGAFHSLLQDASRSWIKLELFDQPCNRISSWITGDNRVLSCKPMSLIYIRIITIIS